MSKEKVDQRIDAWEKVVDHPLWKDCFEADGTLIDEMLAKMDRLWAKENPLPTTPGTVFRATEIRGKACDVKVMVSSTRTGKDRIYFSSHIVSGTDLHTAKNITVWEPIEVPNA